MDSKKIVIVVLILIIVVFVIFVTRGSLTDDQPKRGSRADAADFVKKKKTPNWMRSVKGLFGSLGKKMSLACAEPAPAGVDFQCAAMALGTDINIPPEPGTSFRTATFVLVKGGARIEYRDRTDKADDFDLDEQDFDLPNSETEDPKIGSIVALEKGGRLKITCLGTQTCQVRLQ